MKVAILGSTGMLGSMVRRYLSEQPGYDISVIDRDGGMDAERVTAVGLSRFLSGHQYAINCIGIIKPRIDESDSDSVYDAIQVNAVFPHFLADAAEKVGCKVLQIVTDCVYSGITGSYTESSPHDATDVYGKAKSLGEVCSPNVHHLRCSIIGPEPEGRPKDSLLEWFLGQPQGATVKGYTNHRWNGITTLAFAKLCHGLMQEGIELLLAQHITPLDVVSKYYLLHHIACFYGRDDIQLDVAEASTAVDRTLSTKYHEIERALWLAAGYAPRPPIAELVAELAAYK